MFPMLCFYWLNLEIGDLNIIYIICILFSSEATLLFTLSVRQYVTLWRKTWFSRLLFKTAEILSDNTNEICPSNLYIILSICLLFGVLDRFLSFRDFKGCVIYFKVSWLYFWIMFIAWHCFIVISYQDPFTFFSFATYGCCHPCLLIPRVTKV